MKPMNVTSENDYFFVSCALHNPVCEYFSVKVKFCIFWQNFDKLLKNTLLWSKIKNTIFETTLQTFKALVLIVLVLSAWKKPRCIPDLFNRSQNQKILFIYSPTCSILIKQSLFFKESKVIDFGSHFSKNFILLSPKIFATIWIEFKWMIWFKGPSMQVFTIFLSVKITEVRFQEFDPFSLFSGNKNRDNPLAQK